MFGPWDFVFGTYKRCPILYLHNKKKHTFSASHWTFHLESAL